MNTPPQPPDDLVKTWLECSAGVGPYGLFNSIANRAAAWGYLQAKKEFLVGHFKSVAPDETAGPDIFYQ